MPGSSVLLIGASGTIGSPVVKHMLTLKNSFGRVGVLADPAKAARFDKLKEQGIEVVIGSYLDEKCYRGFDTVVSLVGNAIMRLQPAMIEAAIAGGVRHFYPSEYGSDVAQDALANFRYFRDKRVTRDHLVAKAKEHPDFRYTYVLCGPFTEWTASEFYGVDLEGKKVLTYGRPDAMISLTSLEDVARYIVESILLPFDQLNQQQREIRVVGENLTWQSVIDTLGEAQGVKYESTYLPVEIAERNEQEARRRNDEEMEMMWSVKPFAVSGYAIVPGPLDNDKFGFRPESVRETFVRLFGGK